MSSGEFDVIVVGSGASGSWAAMEFTKRGFKTLIIERGRRLVHQADYKDEGLGTHQLPFRGRMPRGLEERDYFIQKPGAPNHAFWNNDRLNTYIYDDKKPFRWLRGSIQGGKGFLWGRQSYRYSEIDFAANKKDGNGGVWPIGYDDIAPWYSYVERHVGISGEKLGLKQLPDSEFQPPIALNIAEDHFKREVGEKFGRVVTIGRTANLTEDKPEQGRYKCQYRSQCRRGCSFGANFTPQSTTFPIARATGLLTEVTDAAVADLEYDPATKRVTGVRVVDVNTFEKTTYKARVVFLCASTAGSTQILLNSISEAMPNGLGNTHDVLGRYLTDHVYGTGAIGELPLYKEYMEYGRRPTGMYIPRFRNIGEENDLDFVRGYNFQSWGGGRSQPTDVSGFGADLKARMRVPGPWRVPLFGFAECLPHKDNRITVDRARPDRYGIPQIKFDMVWRKNELNMVKDLVDQAEQMLLSAGFVNVKRWEEPHAPGTAIHELGTARMGDDPTQSVVNKWNQLHVAPNTFVADGAAFPSGSCVNPTLSLLAFAARAADSAAEMMKEGTI